MRNISEERIEDLVSYSNKRLSRRGLKLEVEGKDDSIKKRKLRIRDGFIREKTPIQFLQRSCPNEANIMCFVKCSS